MWTLLLTATVGLFVAAGHLIRGTGEVEVMTATSPVRTKDAGIGDYLAAPRSTRAKPAATNPLLPGGDGSDSSTADAPLAPGPVEANAVSQYYAVPVKNDPCPSHLRQHFHVKQEHLRAEAEINAGQPVRPTKLSHLTHVLDQAKLRFVYFDPVDPMFGLTNQLITFSSVLFIGAITARSVVVPDGTVPDFFELIDVNETMDKLPCGLRIHPSSAAPPALFTPKGKKAFPRIHLPSRTQVISNPAVARAFMMKQLIGTGAKQGIRLSTVMWHVPFLPEDDKRRLNEQFFFQKLTFSKPILRQADLIRVAMGRALGTVVKAKSAFVEMDGPLSFGRSNRSGSVRVVRPQRYAVLHIRLEQDFVGLGAELKPPTPARMRQFLTRCVKALMPTDINVVYVSSGRLADDVLRLINETMAPRVVVSKAWFPELKSKSVVDAASIVAGARVTNHFDAAADLEIAVGADFVVSADFSSFSKAIQLRRCPLRGFASSVASVEDPTVYTYDWEWSRLSKRHCNDFDSISSVPFYKMIPYVQPVRCFAEPPA